MENFGVVPGGHGSSGRGGQVGAGPVMEEVHCPTVAEGLASGALLSSHTS